MVPRHGALKQGGKVAIPLTLIAAPPPLKPGSHRHTRLATVPYAQVGVGVGALLLVAFAVPVLLVFIPDTLPPESASAARLVLALMLVTFVAVMLEALS